MQFSIGHVLYGIDKTLSNPASTGFIAVVAYFLTDERFVGVPGNGWLLLYLPRKPFPSLLSKSLMLLFSIGFVLRANRYLNRRALNNSVNARFDWSKEIILITGAAGGIGAAAAQKPATRGSKIVVVDVLPLTFPKLDSIYYYKCDLTDFEALRSTAASIEKDIGPPTCVIANAGICRGKSILEASPRDIELTFGVNTYGLIWTVKAFLPAMARRNHGHFLFIASQTGLLSTAGVMDYAASKSATMAIYEGLHTETKHFLKAPKVRISCISPSAVRTKMFDGIKGESNFFLPRLSPDDLGDIIANIIWQEESQNLMTPALAYVSLASKLLPEWMRVAMQDAAADLMTELKPHKPLNQGEVER